MTKLKLGRKRNKTKTLMLSQTTKQNQQSSMDIEKLLKSDLKETINTYFSRYQKTIEHKLGLNKDDLMNDMREQVWKGLLTYDAKKKASLKTYLNTLIKNRFGVLFQRSKIKKNNMINYYADVFGCEDISNEMTTTEDTGESIFIRRQIIMQNQAALSNADRLIYEDLQLGSNLDEMCKAHGLTRIEVTASINRILELINKKD